MKFREKKLLHQESETPEVYRLQRELANSLSTMVALLAESESFEKTGVGPVVFPSSSWYSSSLLEAADPLRKFRMRNRWMACWFRMRFFDGCSGIDFRCPIWQPQHDIFGLLLVAWEGRRKLKFSASFQVVQFWPTSSATSPYWGNTTPRSVKTHHLRAKWSRWNLLSRNGIQMIVGKSVKYWLARPKSRKFSYPPWN